jgi:predicted ATP-dependent serine protease
MVENENSYGWIFRYVCSKCGMIHRKSIETCIRCKGPVEEKEVQDKYVSLPRRSRRGRNTARGAGKFDLCSNSARTSHGKTDTTQHANPASGSGKENTGER